MLDVFCLQNCTAVFIRMWIFASKAIAGRNLRQNNAFTKPVQNNSGCSDDEASSCTSKDEGLECPICWKSFNMVENVPYVLWCVHTLCKNCVLGLRWAIVKFQTFSIQLPLVIACPWCNLLCLRLVYKDELKFPRKNFFLLWMLESINGNRGRARSCSEHQHSWTPNSHGHHHQQQQQLQQHGFGTSPGSAVDGNATSGGGEAERIHDNALLRKCLAALLIMTAKFPLVVIFLLVIVYAVPACAAILVLYILITVLFALPSFLVLYFAYPGLDWLFREIIT